MSLRKPPTRTPAFLQAHKLNALKCTGPRTAEGKARCSLNALKHGGRAHGLQKKLLVAGKFSEAALYIHIRRQIEVAFSLECASDLRRAERYANATFAMARQAGVLRTKLECSLFSVRFGPRSSSLFRFCVRDRWRGVGLAFWVQRKGYWNTGRLMEAMFSPGETSAEPPLGRALESRLRHRVYRLRRPGTWEQEAYGLDENGRRDPSRKARPDLQRLLRKNAGRWWDKAE